MKIDEKTCTGCGECLPYCPVGAIRWNRVGDSEVGTIDQGECVECGLCLRMEICPAGAIYMPELKWPRSVRAAFSNPLGRYPAAHRQKRGRGDMKTNDVTGRFRQGIAGVGVEVGRPGSGTTFRDIQTICMNLVRRGVEFEPENPVTLLMDKKTGKINAEVLDEKILFATIEFKVEIQRLKETLEALTKTAEKIDTVFSLGVISRVHADGSVPTISVAREAGYSPGANPKVNIGLGRPLAEEA